MIPMNDFKKEYTQLRPHMLKAIDQTLQSGQYVLGKNVKKFERNFAKYIGARYCIGVANGLEALQISLMVLVSVRETKLSRYQTRRLLLLWQ